MFIKIKQFIDLHEKYIIAVLAIFVLIIQIDHKFFYSILPNESIPIIILISLMLADDIINIKNSLKLAGISVIENQTDLLNNISNFIKNTELNNVFMIEYSTATITRVIEALIDHGEEINKKPNIFLLIQYPETGRDCVGQEGRILGQIHDVLYHEKKIRDYKNLHILLYKTKAAVRGRNFDNKLINIGWYSYLTDDNGLQRVYGHYYSSINFYKTNNEFSKIKLFFDKTFSNLWTHASTLSDMREQYKNDTRYPKFDTTDFNDWCIRVSPPEQKRNLPNN